MNVAALCSTCFGAVRIRQQTLTLSRKEIDFVKHDFHVFALLFQLRTTALQLDCEFLKLALLIIGKVVQLEQFTQLAKGKGQAFTAKGEFEADPVAVAVNAVDAFSGGRHQTLIFIVAQRACGHAKLLGEFADSVGFTHCAMQHSRVTLI